MPAMANSEGVMPCTADSAEAANVADGVEIAKVKEVICWSCSSARRPDGVIEMDTANAETPACRVLGRAGSWHHEYDVHRQGRRGWRRGLNWKGQTLEASKDAI